LNAIRRWLFSPRYRWLWRIGAAVLTAVLFYLATLPSRSKPPSFGWDVIDHALAFTALAVALWFACRRWPRRLWWVLGLCLVAGVGIEVAQLFVPSRRSEVADVIVDMVGASLGVALARVAERWLDRRRLPRADAPDSTSTGPR
jgi:VanZ family protein